MFTMSATWRGPFSVVKPKFGLRSAVWERLMMRRPGHDFPGRRPHHGPFRSCKGLCANGLAYSERRPPCAGPVSAPVWRYLRLGPGAQISSPAVTRNYIAVILMPTLDLFHATATLLSKSLRQASWGDGESRGGLALRGSLWPESGFHGRDGATARSRCRAQSRLQMTCGVA